MPKDAAKEQRCTQDAHFGAQTLGNIAQHKFETAGSLRDGVPYITHIDAESACKRMRQEHAAEQCMMFGFHGAALRQALNALGTPTAGAVQRQPVAAGLEPRFQSAHCSAVG
jgi:hypothetical protein